MTADDTPTPFHATPKRLEESRERIASFLRDRVIESGHEGLVVPLTDLLEPAVVAMLAADALGADRVRGVRAVRGNGRRQTPRRGAGHRVPRGPDRTRGTIDCRPGVVFGAVDLDVGLIDGHLAESELPVR